MKKVVLYDSFQFGKGKMLKLHMEKIQDIKEEIESDGNEIIGEFYDKCNEFLRPEKRPEYLRLYELCNTDEVNELYVITINVAEVPMYNKYREFGLRLKNNAINLFLP